MTQGYKQCHAQQSQVAPAAGFGGETGLFGPSKVLGLTDNLEVAGGTSKGDNRLPANKDCGGLND